MRTATHGNRRGLDDLYILPETEQEAQAIQDWLNDKGRSWTFSQSDIPGQDWQSKWFFDIPFGEPLLDELSAALAQQGGA